MKRNILLTPGPATTTDSVKNALVVSDMWTRHKEFEKLVKSIREDLVKIAGGDKDYTCVLFAGSGTAAMEACVCSVVPEPMVLEHRGQYAMIISNGMYGQRFRTMASANSIKNIEIGHPYGKKIDIKRIKKLIDIPNIGGVFVTHHETTTGVLNDVKEIGKIVKGENIPYVVDAISSFGGLPLNIKDIKADFVIATSNKCLQGMPGISFVIAKKDELEKCKFNMRSVYLDLYRQWKYLEDNNQFPFTPPVQVLYALRKALDELFDEGLENRQKRYQNCYKMLLKGMKARGFKQFLTNDVVHSGLLETYHYLDHSNFDYQTFQNRLYEKGFIIYESVISNTFRLCNLGAINVDDIKGFLRAVDEVLEGMGCR